MKSATTRIAALLTLALTSGAAQAQAETAAYTMTFQGLWTADDITDASLPGGAHFTEVIGATHNSATTIWVSGGTASAGVENVAELGSVGTLVNEIGRQCQRRRRRQGGEFLQHVRQQTVSSTFTVKCEPSPGLGPVDDRPVAGLVRRRLQPETVRQRLAESGG